jgi:hypothetical protein
MKITIIETIITIAGIVFVCASLFIIIFGKKVEERAGQHQKIKISYMKDKTIEVNLSSILMMLFLFILFALTPLLLHFIKIDPDNFTSNRIVEESYIKKDIVKKDYIKIKDLTLNINCFVLEKENQSFRFADRVNVVAKRIDEGGAFQVFRGETDSMGNLSFCLSDIQINKNYQITWMKSNYQEFKENLRFGYVNIPVTLSKGGN